MTGPCCTIIYVDQRPQYTVYDRWGSIMVHTGSRAVAQQFLDMARKGISARVYYWLERWNYRVPKRYLNRT